MYIIKIQKRTVQNERRCICEKYELTYMEFTVLMFLANNPQYDTATQIVRYRHLAKSHVSVSIRSLQERGLILGEHKGGNHRTIHLSVAGKQILLQPGVRHRTNFVK